MQQPGSLRFALTAALSTHFSGEQFARESHFFPPGQAPTVHNAPAGLYLLYLLMDSRGLKIHGEGDWKVRQYKHSKPYSFYFPLESNHN